MFPRNDDVGAPPPFNDPKSDPLPFPAFSYPLALPHSKMVVSSAPSILFPPLSDPAGKGKGAPDESSTAVPWRPSTPSPLPHSRTETLLSWISRLDSRLLDLRSARRRDLRLEVLVSCAEVAAQAELDQSRRSRRARLSAFLMEGGGATSSCSSSWSSSSPSTSPFPDEESSRLDSFFDEMDCANNDSSHSAKMKKRTILAAESQQGPMSKRSKAACVSL